ncbi:cyclin-dependent protein kinase complex component [Grosmannia clavigera kw1407]|uniref:Cyclin-dependent protein kinase complex component n=1 Tax=Grosmannia clavigera (strain kw1407 / UAMH 11150) TaxID=655863 RepID=F0XQC5_GROCL|nr:cyclin-dependent protein kinase complex component [Grosmannia clavigera kw1407]EFX00470.1 cyclin-dependent protein kinase complex component [Grosmannia clavigera kw1407]
MAQTESCVVSGANIHLDGVSPPRLDLEADSIFDISPLVALQLLCASVEALVRITGDVPPSPPTSGISTETNMREMDAEKASIVRTLSANSLAQLRAQAEKLDKSAGVQVHERSLDMSTPSARLRMPPTPPPVRPIVMEIDGVHLKQSSPSGPPEREPTPLSPKSMSTSPSAAAAAAFTPVPYIIIGADSQPLNVQHSAISRKFYSKAVPPFSISQYLKRLHRYCPMSTAVYLATSLYIYRLAVIDKVIAVTRRNSHRLLLAGLRVAMKALEDRNHSHSKMSKVGGVSEAELARLEIHFCFLVGFDVIVQADQIQQHWLLMKRGSALGPLDLDETVTMTVMAS